MIGLRLSRAPTKSSLTGICGNVYEVTSGRIGRVADVAEEVDGELISEEDVDTSQPGEEVRALPREFEAGSALPAALRNEVTTAAIAVAGGALAGAATVAAVRAVSGGSSKRKSRKLGRRTRPANVVASRSFLVDVHVLGR